MAAPVSRRRRPTGIRMNRADSERSTAQHDRPTTQVTPGKNVTEPSVKAIIESFHRHRQANDVEGCLAYFSPDATFRMAGSADASGIAGSHKGAEAVRQLLSALIANWEWKSVRIDSVIIQNERAALHFELAAVFKPNLTPVNTEIVDILTVRDGKITSFVEFVDTALAAKVAGAQ